MVTTVEREFLRPWIRRPGPEDHKHSRGVVAFHTGSSTYPGAALMGIQAALATGVGMVRYCGPEDVSRLVLSCMHGLRKRHPELTAVALSPSLVYARG